MAGRQYVVIDHEVLEAARVRIAAGEAYHIVAKDVGVAAMTLRRRLDPSYDRRCRDIYHSGGADAPGIRVLNPVVVEEAARAAAERDQLYDVSTSNRSRRVSTTVINSTGLGTPLTTLLMCDAIEPGSSPSYQICKEIYLYHPLGARISEAPIAMAQSQQREISIPAGPEDRLRERFEEQRKADNVDKYIFNVHAMARVYGISSLALLVDGLDSDKPVDYEALYKQDIAYNVFDPLNTAGSLVLNQNPNDLTFQKTTTIAVQGKSYHRSRSVVVLNGNPVYISYTGSGFGYTGRSCYQRALYPLKSFINTMVTDDLVVRKAGVLVAMIKAAGTIIDNVMQVMTGRKRDILKEAESGAVISIGQDDKVESINFQNLEGPYTQARKNILENIANAADGMPAKLLNSESFAEGFGEGTEDAKHVARYIDRIREQMDPTYEFCDKITMYRAWNPEFYKTIQKEFPAEYGSKSYTVAFAEWKNSFVVKWPSLLTEPPSEEIKVDDVKLRAVVSLLEILLPEMDPENKVKLIAWACDNFNELKLMFGSHLTLDYDALENYEPEEQAAPGEEAPDADGDKTTAPAKPKPEGLKKFADSASGRALTLAVNAAVAPRLTRRDTRVSARG